MENIEIPEGRNPKLNAYIAVSVAILAALLGIGKIKDDNICQGMAKAKADAVDYWNQYQAEKLKGRFEDLKIFQIESTQIQNPSLSGAFDEKLTKLHENIDRYAASADKLKVQAEDQEHLYDALNFRDDQFDLADAGLAISLALFAVTALLGSMTLFFISWFFGGFGAVMCLAGLVGWSIHPDWIVQLLS